MPGALNDILSAQDDSVFMRHLRFNREGEPEEETVPHLHSAAGFLDDSWWSRTYWFFGSKMDSGYGGWPNMAHLAPSGQLLVVEGPRVYGFGRNHYRRHGGSHPWLAGPTGSHYRLFAQDTNLDPRQDPEEKVFPWQKRIDLLARAMVLAEGTLFVAGPADPQTVADPVNALEGHAGGLLWAVSAGTGEQLAVYRLAAPPVFDGMIAVESHLYVSCTDGRVVCMAGGEQE
jgi:hypothetical protein